MKDVPCIAFHITPMIIQSKRAGFSRTKESLEARMINSKHQESHVDETSRVTEQEALNIQSHYDSY